MTNSQILAILDSLDGGDLTPSVSTDGRIAVMPTGGEADAAARRHGYKDQQDARRHFVFKAGGK